MTEMPWRPPGAVRKRVQLLAHSTALRTALRRGLATTPYVLATENDASAQSGVARRADVIVVDLDVAMRGLGLVERIASADPRTPVIAILLESTTSPSDRAAALDRGAAAVVVRPNATEPLALRGAADDILRAIERIEREGRRPAVHQPAPRSRAGRVTPQVLVVGSSTGGPQALMAVFSQLPPAAVRVPVLIVQHMPAAFTPILAEHLSRATSWKAVEARPDEPLTAGEIRIAPGGNHLVVTAGRRLKLTESPPVNFCRPSADVLFVSAAEVFGPGVLAVILTGMGSDGAEGAKAIAAAGGTVFAQDKETSVVWGMPGAAFQTGVVDRVLPLDSIAASIQSAVSGAFA